MTWIHSKQHLDVKRYDHRIQHAHIHICAYTYAHIHIYTYAHTRVDVYAHTRYIIHACTFQKTFFDLTNTTIIRLDNHSQPLVNDHVSAFMARFCLLFGCAAECLGHAESLLDLAVAWGGYRRLQEAKESWKGAGFHTIGHRIGNSGLRGPLLGNDDPKISGFLPYNQFRK